MDETDKRIIIATLSKQVGRAVQEWSKRNGIDADVCASVTKTHPSCFIDEQGVVHHDCDLVTVNIDIMDDDDDDDDFND